MYVCVISDIVSSAKASLNLRVPEKNSDKLCFFMNLGEDDVCKFILLYAEVCEEAC